MSLVCQPLKAHQNHSQLSLLLSIPISSHQVDFKDQAWLVLKCSLNLLTSNTHQVTYKVNEHGLKMSFIFSAPL